MKNNEENGSNRLNSMSFWMVQLKLDPEFLVFSSSD